MDIQLRRVAFGVGKSDFVAFLHQGPNRNRQFVEIVASTGINLAIFQWQAVTARDQDQDFSFCRHVVLLSEIESVSRKSQLAHRSPICETSAPATALIGPPAPRRTRRRLKSSWWGKCRSLRRRASAARQHPVRTER